MLLRDVRLQYNSTMISDTNEIDMEVEDAWNEEIARRIQDLDSGKAKTIPLEEVRRRVSAKLNNGQ